MAKSKSTPTPTLAQLRKLEAKKGLLDFDEYTRDKRVVTELWWRGTLTLFGTFYEDLKHPAVRRAVFGVLSALPDKGGPRG